jgi:hypothetical protein
MKHLQAHQTPEIRQLKQIVEVLIKTVRLKCLLKEKQYGDQRQTIICILRLKLEMLHRHLCLELYHGPTWTAFQTSIFSSLCSL